MAFATKTTAVSLHSRSTSADAGLLKPVGAKSTHTATNAAQELAKLNANKELARHCLLAADKYLKDSQFDLARQELDKALKLDPSNGYIYAFQDRISYFEEQKKKEAAARPAAPTPAEQTQPSAKVEPKPHIANASPQPVAPSTASSQPAVSKPAVPVSPPAGGTKAEPTRQPEQKAVPAIDEQKKKEELRLAEEARLKEMEAKAAEERRRKEMEERAAAEERARKELEERIAQEERKRKELEVRIAAEERRRKEEELRIAEEQRRKELEEKSAAEQHRLKELEQRAVEEENRRRALEQRVVAEEQRRRELEAKAAEEKKRQEEEARALEELRRKEEQERLAEERKKFEEMRRQVEELTSALEQEKKAREEVSKRNLQNAVKQLRTTMEAAWINGAPIERVAESIHELAVSLSIPAEVEQSVQREVKLDVYSRAVKEVIAKRKLLRNSSSTLEWLRKVYQVSVAEYLENESKFLLDLVADQYKGTILFISKSIGTKEDLTQRLKSSGYAIVQSTAPENALEKIEKVNPNLILCDTEFPNGSLSGLRFLHLMRANSKFNFIPFILLSEQAETSPVQSTDLKPNEGCIKRPIDYEELTNLINEKLAHFRDYISSLA